MTAEHECGAEISQATATARRTVSAALLAALDTARWPDGSRLVDVSDHTIQQRLVPALTDELIAQFSRASDVDTGAAI
ncbi:hypothetical protein AB0F43_31905 [Kribbella sp. NPDC023972]|uniref:hypothetical protein n=1 Tax=Kribbella sp. NPDC023972 TaxID=3154795 RepID=UPI003402ECE8